MTFLSAADVRPFGQAKVRKKKNQLYEETKTRKLKRKGRGKRDKGAKKAGRNREKEAGKRARQENTRREKDIPCRDIKKGGTSPPFFFVLSTNSFPNNVGATRSLRHIADNRSPPTFG